MYSKILSVEDHAKHCFKYELALSKGQIISEQKRVSLIFQKCNEIIARISALASKIDQI